MVRNMLIPSSTNQNFVRIGYNASTKEANQRKKTKIKLIEAKAITYLHAPWSPPSKTDEAEYAQKSTTFPS